MPPLESRIHACLPWRRLTATQQDRAVLHPALRAPRDAVIEDAGKNVVPEVWAVLDKIKAFTGEELGRPVVCCPVRVGVLSFAVVGSFQADEIGLCCCRVCFSNAVGCCCCSALLLALLPCCPCCCLPLHCHCCQLPPLLLPLPGFASHSRHPPHPNNAPPPPLVQSACAVGSGRV